MKEKTFAFRVSGSDLDRIKSKVRQAGMTATDYLVRTALGKKIIVVEGLPEMISELKAIGRNLNQLTVLANMGRISVTHLREFIEQFTELLIFSKNEEKGEEMKREK